jgi:alanine-glyoxylate transaminase/serine-glyoxylate transaminase/serine-pyruvate transaminase
MAVPRSLPPPAHNEAQNEEIQTVMTLKRGRSFLMTPGPTPVPERILNAMHRQPIDYNGPELITLARSCLEDIKPIFKTAAPVFVYTASGHGAWEAALSNTLSPGDRILVPESGNFSLGWMEIAEALGLEAIYLENDWRHAIDPDQVEARLAEDRGHEIKAVLMVHTDTATGITSDVPALRRAIDRAGHPALLMVDTIASLATTDFRMDEWQVDVAVGASQKGLMMPPGLSFTAASQKALRAAETAVMPRRYWDWRERRREPAYKWFCGTAPEHLLFALREAIDMVMEEGLEAIFARHARLAEAVRRTVAAWAEGGALAFNALVPEERANSVTTILTAEGIDADRVRVTCRESFDVSLGAGLRKLDGRAFRIGHMGDINEPMILGALASVEAALKTCGVPHGTGGVTAAVEFLAESAESAESTGAP